MSIIQGTAKSGGTGEFYNYPIEQSLRFDGTSYLSWTPSFDGDRITWTWSGWVKRSLLYNSRQSLFVSGSANYNLIVEFSNDSFRFGGYSLGNGSSLDGEVTTTQLLKDTSSWYHLVAIYSSDEATPSDRLRIYVNGQLVTDLSSSLYPQQGRGGFINRNQEHKIGGWYTTSYYFNGYMANIQFIDGQALDPSSFGELKSGVWVPKAYTGTYGRNGFHLDFADPNDIGNDVSGMNNHWTVN